MSRYSFSQIQLFQTCPLKYRYQYIDKIDIKEESLSLALWIAVHATLEFLYNSIFSFSNKKPELNILLTYFQDYRHKEIWCFSQKPDQSTAYSYYDRWFSCITSYYNTYYPFDKAEFVRSELKVQIQLSKDITLQGKIDRVDIANNEIEIIDYKTNQLLSNTDAIIHKEQIELYGLGISQMYDWNFKSITWRIIYLHFGKEDVRDINLDILELICEKYLRLCQTIDTTKLQFAFFQPDAFQANVWSHCVSCKFRDLCIARKKSA